MMSAPASPPLTPPGKWLSGKRWLYGIFLILYVWAYAYLGTLLIEGANTNRNSSTQATYIDAVYDAAAANVESSQKSFYASHFSNLLPHYMTLDVDPLWPWLMQLYAHETPDTLFEKGKWFNLIVSGGVLLLMGLIAARAYSFSGSAGILLMGGFSIILERSAYFSPDAFFYLLIALVWLCALSLIRQNHLWLHGVMGVLLALAYLAKPLIWPIVVAYVVVSLVRAISVGLRPGRNTPSNDLWNAQNQFVGLAVMTTTFLLLAGPRLSFASEQFNDPFYSSQKHLVWLDSPEEAQLFRQAMSLPSQSNEDQDSPASEAFPRPGMRTYLQRHGMEAMWERSWSGAIQQVKTSALGRGGWVLLYGFVVFCAVAAIHRWTMFRQSREVWRVRGTSARWMLLFLAITVSLTLFQAGMGDPLISNNSMTTSLFLPILITFIWISERYRRQLQRSRYATLVNKVYLSLMALPILWVTYKIYLTISTPLA